MNGNTAKEKRVQSAVRFGVFIFLFFAAYAFPAGVSAAICEWTGAGPTNNVSDAGNWTCGAPQGGDTLSIYKTNDTIIWDAAAPATVQDIYINVANTFGGNSFSGILDFNGSDVVITGVFDINNRQSLESKDVTVYLRDGDIQVGGHMSAIVDGTSNVKGDIFVYAGTGGTLQIGGDLQVDSWSGNIDGDVFFYGEDKTVLVSGALKVGDSINSVDEGGVYFYAGTGGSLDVGGDIILETKSTYSTKEIFFDGGTKNITAQNMIMQVWGSGGIVEFNAGSAGALNVAGRIFMTGLYSIGGSTLTFNGQGKDITADNIILQLSNGRDSNITFNAGSSGMLSVTGTGAGGDSLFIDNQSYSDTASITFDGQQKDITLGSVLIAAGGNSSTEGTTEFLAGNLGNLTVSSGFKAQVSGGISSSAPLFVYDNGGKNVFVGGDFEINSSGIYDYADVTFTGGTGILEVEGGARFLQRSDEVESAFIYSPQSFTLKVGGELNFEDDSGAGAMLVQNAGEETYWFDGNTTQNPQFFNNYGSDGMLVGSIIVAHTGIAPDNKVNIGKKTVLLIHDAGLYSGVWEMPADYTILVFGDWINTGGFLTSQQGSVAFINFGTPTHTIKGSTTFYDLSYTAKGTLLFGTNDTQTVLGTLTLRGQNSTNLLELKPTVSGAQWRIDAQGARNLCNLDILWSRNINANPMVCNGNCVGVDDPSTPQNEGDISNTGWEWDPNGGGCSYTPPPGGGPAPGAGNVKGFSWAGNDTDADPSTEEGILWSSFNSDFGDFGGSDVAPYSVNVDTSTGVFSGYAWNGLVGWISFEESDLQGCPGGECKAVLDWATGEVSGWGRVLSCTGNIVTNGFVETEVLKADTPVQNSLLRFTAISDDGKRIVGASLDGAGKAYVKDYVSGVWQESILTASNGDSGDGFWAVDASANGDVVVAGAPWEASDGSSPLDNSMTSAGAAYVWEESSGGAWQETYIKPAVVGAGDQFGFSVAVNEAGDVMVVGAPEEDSAYAPPSDWWHGDWKKRMKLTLDASGMPSAAGLRAFPALVTIPSLFNYSATQPLGQDLRFVSDSISQADCEAAGYLGGVWNTNGFCELHYDIDEWNPGGTSFVWVMLPKVERAVNEFWMYYQNPAAPAGESGDDGDGLEFEAADRLTFYPRYEAVWHMGDFSNPFAVPPPTISALDASGYSTPADGYNVDVDSNGNFVDKVNAFIGSGVELDGVDEYFHVAPPFVNQPGPSGVEARFPGEAPTGGVDGFTFSAWVKPDPGGGGVLLAKDDAGAGNRSYSLTVKEGQPAYVEVFGDASTNPVVLNGATNITSAWTHVALQWKGGASNPRFLRLWVNGVLDAELVDDAAPYDNVIVSSAPFRVGNRGDGWTSTLFDGVVDEVRVASEPLGATSGTEDSGDWIMCEYGNQYQQGVNLGKPCLLTLGAEEDLVLVPDPTNDNLADSGAAYVFEKQGGVWTQTAFLKASNPDAEDNFGLFVDISGNTIVVGAIGEDGNGNDPLDNSVSEAGAAYVFEKQGGVWTQTAYLKKPSPQSNDLYYKARVVGGTIAMSTGPEWRSLSPGGQADKIIIFQKTEGTWNYLADITRPSSANVAAPFFVGAITSGANTLVAHGTDAVDPSKTIVFVYSKNADGVTWDVVDAVLPSTASPESVYFDAPDVVPSGERFIATYALEDTTLTDSGAGYVFDETSPVGSCSGGGWVALDSSSSQAAGGTFDFSAFDVYVDPYTGVFRGWAWSDDFGWMRFNNNSKDFAGARDTEDYYVYIDGINACPFSPDTDGTGGPDNVVGRKVVDFRPREFDFSYNPLSSVDIRGGAASVEVIDGGAYEVTLAWGDSSVYGDSGAGADEKWNVEFLEGALVQATTPVSVDLPGGTALPATYQQKVNEKRVNPLLLLAGDNIDTAVARHGASADGNAFVPICVALDPTCPFEDKQGRTIIEFSSGGLGWGKTSNTDAYLTTDDVNNTKTGLVSLGTPLPAGYYDVSLASWDGHAIGGYTDTDMNESFYLSLEDASGEVVATSPIGDIADGDDFAYGNVQNDLYIPKDITGARGVASLEASAPTSESNSVYAVCAAFDLNPPRIIFNPDSFPDVIEGTKVNFSWEIKGPYSVCQTRVACPDEPDPYNPDPANCDPANEQPKWLALNNTVPPSTNNFETDPIYNNYWLEMRCKNDSLDLSPDTGEEGWSPWTVVNVFKLTQCNDGVDNDGDGFCDTELSTECSTFSNPGSDDLGTRLGDPGCYNSSRQLDQSIDDESLDEVEGCGFSNYFADDGICQDYWGETPLNCPNDCGFGGTAPF